MRSILTDYSVGIYYSSIKLLILNSVKRSTITILKQSIFTVSFAFILLVLVLSILHLMSICNKNVWLSTFCWHRSDIIYYTIYDSDCSALLILVATRCTETTKYTYMWHLINKENAMTFINRLDYESHCVFLKHAWLFTAGILFKYYICILKIMLIFCTN